MIGPTPYINKCQDQLKWIQFILLLTTAVYKMIIMLFDGEKLGSTPWDAITEWTISRRTRTPRIKARRRELNFHVIPFATPTGGSPMIEPLSSLLSQTARGVLSHMRHEVRMLWHIARISTMQIISWGRATDFYMWKSYRSILSVLKSNIIEIRDKNSEETLQQKTKALLLYVWHWP